MSETNGVRLHGRTRGWPNWTTPKNVIEVVSQVGPIVLDPCWNDQAITMPVSKFWENGCEQDWRVNSEGGLVFVNPPYNQAKAFVEKCIQEGLWGAEIILLVASRTDTKWSHAAHRSADAMCNWGPGRIKFENPPSESPGDAPSIASSFFYWGRNHRLFTQVFSKHGFCVNLHALREKRSFPVQVLP